MDSYVDRILLPVQFYLHLVKVDRSSQKNQILAMMFKTNVIIATKRSRP